MKTFHYQTIIFCLTNKFLIKVDRSYLHKVLSLSCLVPGMDSQTAVAVQSLIDSQVITETTTGERFLYSEVLPLNESLCISCYTFSLSCLILHSSNSQSRLN